MKPLEVVRVDPPMTPIQVVWAGLLMPLAAWCLMFAVPLAHDTLGAPDRAPGYWSCLLLVALVRVIKHAFRSTLPAPSTEEILAPAVAETHEET